MDRIKQAGQGMCIPLLVAVFAILWWGLPIPGPCAHAETEGLADVVLVIDNSGSMRKNDPAFLMPKTVSTFLAQLPASARVAMVRFDQQARLLEPLSSLSDPKTRQALTESLNQIDYRGRFTDSAAGLERAVYELKTAGRPDARQSIIFLTDGIVDTGSPKKDAELTRWLKTDLVDDCTASGIHILGIAFTEKADFPLIQTLASRTDGVYFRATRAEDIAGVLDQIQAHLLPSVEETAPVAIVAPSPAPVVPPVPPAVTQTAPPPSPTETPPAPAPPETPDGFGTISLPMLLIIALLIVLVAFLVFKVFNRPPAVAPPKASPISVPLMEAPFPPNWELQPLDDSDTAVHRYDQARLTIGRDSRNDLVLAAPTVSNLHATIVYRDRTFFLEDQRSTNGTRLNGQRVTAHTPAKLKSGDLIQFADRVFKFIRLDQLISGDTVMLDITALGAAMGEPPSIHSAVAEPEKRFQDCLVQHLEQIRRLGGKYNQFVETYFSEAMVSAIAVQAWENMQQVRTDPDQGCSSMIKGSAFYVICALPVPAAEAAGWFGKRYGGFTRFISRWIKSDGYDVTACDLFCMITSGMRQDQPWVSLTVVPTHDEPDPVEIMSVKFLSDDEKKDLGLEFDNHGRVL
ncbi:hypothetical protein DESC_940101 [Desulfosarcina cetonica]|uniref:FHA domain-containing protein n=1 Tax=Desulfosarcina cetonica TaxID=90730 RepID=UPI0006D1E0C4|nr:FHA domain-containing protein [Desulfosarcina cetonica]VTR71486.1 hypothetical protein DESC_940101 [Desulfosarcina cetonica]